LKKIRESLAGRASIYELWPLTMSELCRELVEKDVHPPLLDRLLSSEGINSVLDGEPETFFDETDIKYREAESISFSGAECRPFFLFRMTSDGNG
jgi:predicted AAA+ superfamily ATPase